MHDLSVVAERQVPAQSHAALHDVLDQVAAAVASAPAVPVRAFSLTLATEGTPGGALAVLRLGRRSLAPAGWAVTARLSGRELTLDAVRTRAPRQDGRGLP